jgi:hypothetical protein
VFSILAGYRYHDLTIVKKDVEDLKETSSIIEGRLVQIEKQTGYVKA